VKKVPPGVYTEDIVEVLVGSVGYRLLGVDPCIGHHDGRIPKYFLRFCKQTPDICRLGHVSLNSEGLPSSFGYGQCDFASRRRAERVIDYYRRTPFGQLLRDSAPDATRTSSNDCGFSL
jgi:hypothetical protein